MGLLSDLYDTVFGSTPASVDTDKAHRARTFQLQNQACDVVRKCLDTNGIPYDDHVKTTVLSLVTHSSLSDPVNRHQLIGRCAYFFGETQAMKKRRAAIDKKRRAIASVNRLRGDLAKMLETQSTHPDAP
ncbi:MULTISPECIES: hypothetical protein [Rhodanobacteraceae]|uniref:hypothetical protein n=1 Tax=Rhodanobacteraceae TaxID=1775411 RepID=UPI00088DD03B|nr:MULTISPECIES: hypothetical protein [Rhodanobacteraceae]SDF96744.1 hypothetical protein SAMN04515659_1766 [Dyella sp. 333MFSha]SKB32984.1 hypothetical protein SAMN05660880_00613 [Luteibacter sp. 22Crub2.1]